MLGLVGDKYYTKNLLLIFLFFCSLYTLCKDMSSNWKKIWKCTDNVPEKKIPIPDHSCMHTRLVCIEQGHKRSDGWREQRLYREECRTTTGSQAKEILGQISLFFRIWVKQNIFTHVHEVDLNKPFGNLLKKTLQHTHTQANAHTSKLKLCRLMIELVNAFQQFDPLTLSPSPSACRWWCPWWRTGNPCG